MDVLTEGIGSRARTSLAAATGPASSDGARRSGAGALASDSPAAGSFPATVAALPKMAMFEACSAESACALFGTLGSECAAVQAHTENSATSELVNTDVRFRITATELSATGLDYALWTKSECPLH